MGHAHEEEDKTDADIMGEGGEWQAPVDRAP